MAVQNLLFLPGDIIERDGPVGTKHRGVFVGWNLEGSALVIHNAKDDRVRRDLFETFAEGLPVSRVSRVARNLYEQNMIVERAQSLLGKQFDLLNFNCDHLVTYALAGVAISPQLRTFAAGLAGLVVLVGIAVTASKA